MILKKLWMHTNLKCMMVRCSNISGFNFKLETIPDNTVTLSFYSHNSITLRKHICELTKQSDFNLHKPLLQNDQLNFTYLIMHSIAFNAALCIPLQQQTEQSQNDSAILASIKCHTQLIKASMSQGRWL